MAAEVLVPDVTVSQPARACHPRAERGEGTIAGANASLGTSPGAGLARRWRGWPHRSGARIALLGALAACALPGLAAAAGWEKFAHDDGVTVYIQDDAQREIPRFKGVATVEAEPLLILAVLADVARSCEWNAACVHSNILETRSEFEVIFHNRLRATWPVSDRDAVLRTGARILDAGARVVATFDAISWPAVRPAKGVVRFPVLHGRYDIRRVAPGRSHLEYVIDSAPGGMIPNWFVRYGVKNVPTSTIAGLRRQIVKRGASYADFVTRHAAAAGEAGAAAKGVAPAPEQSQPTTKEAPPKPAPPQVGPGHDP